MPASHKRGLRAMAALFVLLCGIVVSRATVHTNRQVILITIDGLAASYLSDPRAPLPTLRKLAAAGAVAEGLRVSNPSVTWPNHTTLVTGVTPEKHSVLFNGKLIRGGPGEALRLDGERDKLDLVAVPTVYDQLHAAGFRIANINWPCTRNAPTIADNFPDVPDPVAHMTPRLRSELIRLGALTDDRSESFRSRGMAAADQTWTTAAVHLLRNRPPHLLLLHLLVTDAIQHQYGPQSSAAYTAIALADANVAEVLRALDATGRRDQATIIIASDHGFARPTKLINPNVVFRKAGWFRPSPRRQAQALSEGGTAFVYLTQPASKAMDHTNVVALLRNHEGIAEIIAPEHFQALGLPHPERNPQMGDLILVAKEGYAFANESFEDESITEIKTPVGSHGYLATDPKMQGVFIATGHGIKPGMKLGLVENVDVAPTIAALFGQKLQTADGKVLREILTEPEK